MKISIKSATKAYMQNFGYLILVFENQKLYVQVISEIWESDKTFAIGIDEGLKNRIETKLYSFCKLNCF